MLSYKFDFIKIIADLQSINNSFQLKSDKMSQTFSNIECIISLKYKTSHSEVLPHFFGHRLDNDQLILRYLSLK